MQASPRADTVRPWWPSVRRSIANLRIIVVEEFESLGPAQNLDSRPLPKERPELIPEATGHGI